MSDSSRRVLVTGAAGFVGSAVCRALRQTEFEVVGLVRHLPKEDEGVPGVRYEAGDILEPAKLTEEAFAGCTDVVHTVGIIVENHGRGETFEAVHVGGTANVLRAAQRGGGIERRFVYISALGAAPDAPSRYSRTKARAEKLVEESGLSYTILRPSIILGPGAAFLKQIEALIRRPPLAPFPLPFVPIPGSGKNRFQPVAVEDVAGAVVRCLLEEEGLSDQIVEIGGADIVTFDELVQAVASRIDLAKKPLKHIPMPLMFTAAAILEALLPLPPVTTDQLTNLKRDTVCEPDPLSEILGRDPDGLESMLERIYTAD